jgi:mxaJ protein
MSARGTGLLLLPLLLATAGCGGTSRVLRVCSDPNNMPFSNARGEGFENALAQLVAADLNARVEYTWWAQRRGFIRNTLGAHTCDVIMGLPSAVEMALTTRPYYRSTYVFVTRRDDPASVHSLDDPELRVLRVGVQMIGDDYANAPPAQALAQRGIIHNVRGYTVYGDYAEPAPAARIIEAVADDEIDVAIAWGAMAGYHASRAAVPLALVPVMPQVDVPFLPMVFDIAMAVRREDIALRDELNTVILNRRAEIGQLLDRYHVPRLPVHRVAERAP